MKRLSKDISTLPITHNYNNTTYFVQNDLILFWNLKCHLLKSQSPVWGGGLNDCVYQYVR